MRKIFFITFSIFFLTIALSASADTLGERKTFNVDSGYDLNGRKEVEAILVKSTPRLYFYIDEDWWNFSAQNEVFESLTNMEQEFEENIYPIITSLFGPEWKPGIDHRCKLPGEDHHIARLDLGLQKRNILKQVLGFFFYFRGLYGHTTQMRTHGRFVMGFYFALLALAPLVFSFPNVNRHGSPRLWVHSGGLHGLHPATRPECYLSCILGKFQGNVSLGPKDAIIVPIFFPLRQKSHEQKKQRRQNPIDSDDIC